MLSAAVLLLGAHAQCGLPASIDPDGICNVDSGWSNIDMDSVTGASISVTISTKGEYTDATGVVHGATQGTLNDNTATDGRYILSCPQAAGQKTVKITVARPKEYGGTIDGVSAFKAEWVQLFPKDSWTKVAEAFEPFEMNDYGSIIPLQQFRPTAQDEDWTAAPIYDYFHAFLEVSGEGDYELKFGNPHLKYPGDNWIAFEFKNSLLRVGSPWADCSGSSSGTPDYTGVGTIIPAYFGNPFHNKATYDRLLSELAGVTLPVKVILQMFGPGFETWTNSATDGVCYKAGNVCPEAHSVCKAEYCVYDRWVKLVSDLKAAASDVSVLAFVETKEFGAARATADISADIASYTAVGTFDGYYFNQVGGGAVALAQVVGIASGLTGFKVMGLGEPLFDASVLDAADVWVTLSVGNADIGVWTPFSWYPAASTSKWSSMVSGVAFGQIAATATALLDRGYGYIYLSTENDFADYPTNGTSPPLPALFTALGSTGRRARALRRMTDQPENPFWGSQLRRSVW
jgi:hypothetical protein